MLKSRVQENLINDEEMSGPPSPMDHTSLEFTFWEGPIGMTLVKDESCRAVVARLVSNGPAEKKGVCVGDIIDSIGGQSFLSYEELMDLILLLPRPVQIQFLRPQLDMNEKPDPESTPDVSTLAISGFDAPLLNGGFGGTLITSYLNNIL